MGAGSSLISSRMLGRLSLVVCLIAATTGCWPAASSEAFSAQVVAADSDQPIESALVVATWMIDYGGMPIGALEIQERETGSDGVFRIDGWKRLLPSRRALVPPGEPVIRIYASGYCPVVLMPNRLRYQFEEMKKRDRSPSKLEPKLRLTPRRMSPNDCEEGESWFMWSTEFLFLTPCAWTHAPKFTLAVSELSGKTLQANGQTRTSFLDSLVKSPDCPDPEQFLREKRNAN